MEALSDQEPPLRVLHEHGVGDAVEERLLECKTVRDLLLGELSIRYVAEADNRTQESAVLDHGGCTILHGEVRSILAPQELVIHPAPLAMLVGLAHGAFFPRVFASVGAVVVNEGVRPLAQEFLRREPQHPARGGVHEGDAALRVGPEDSLVGRLQDEPGPLLGFQDALLLGLEFLGLLLGPLQKLVRFEVALEDLQAHWRPRATVPSAAPARSS